MKTTAILLGLVLVLTLVWAGTAAAGSAPDKWLGERVTISRLDEGRGGVGAAPYVPIATSPDKFTFERPVTTVTRGTTVPCGWDLGMGGGPAGMTYHGEKWMF